MSKKEFDRTEGRVVVHSVGMEIVVTIYLHNTTPQRYQEQRMRCKSAPVARRLASRMALLLEEGAPLARLFEAAVLAEKAAGWVPV